MVTFHFVHWRSNRGSSAFDLIRCAVWMVWVTYGLATQAQMHAGPKMAGFSSAFGIDKQPAADYTVQELEVTIGKNTIVNLLQPGESAQLRLHFVNKAWSALRETGHFEVIHYRTSVPAGDIWTPTVYALETADTQPLTLNLGSHGSQDVVIRPKVGDTFGGYAIVVDMPGHGRAFAATLVRSLVPDYGRVEFPTYALDAPWPNQMNEGVFSMFFRLGVKGMRLGASFDDKDSPADKLDAAQRNRDLTWARKYDVTVMLTIGGAGSAIQPLGEGRPWLDQNGQMLKTKDDHAWLPSADNDFQQWVHGIAKAYGWPRGNVNAMELWNEPWESTSISGWGADIPRYREIFTHMAQGIEEARAQDGTKVLIGGTCSSTNARDKLFSDGTDKFLKWMDYISLHYQAMGADPSLVPEWMNRKGEYGPMRVWDTESWIANSEDRFAGVIASMRAQGQTRTAGIYGGNVYQSDNIKVDGQIYPVIQMWAPAAAVAAATRYIGQRDFDKLLFGEGLPWVFAFRDLPGRHDDGTLVVVGDLAKIYDAGRTPFRSVKVADDAVLVLTDPQHDVRLFDFYGNPLPQTETVSIPLDGRGFFVRASGAPGSFATVLDIVRDGQIKGVQPVEIVAHDMTNSLPAKPSLRVTLTNVLNHKVEGALTAQGNGLTIAANNIPVELAPHEIRDFTFSVSGTPAPNNTYPVHLVFDGGRSGSATHDEAMHVNLIARRTIKIDGDLSDWRGVLPQVLPGTSIGASLTEKAYLPYADFNAAAAEGFSTAYLAYDDHYFYFSAKVADSTPDEGMMRFETRDDNSFFYPDWVTDLHGNKQMWPQSVRHYSYRKGFEIPSSGRNGSDNVQIAFNVIDQKPWLAGPPGTIPHFINYWDTDYEFALNKVAPQYGGGYEVWRLTAPGMPRKHFYPREPASAIDGGPVKDAQLSIAYKNGIRYVEAAIPWHEIPEVRARILAGKTVKFSCRINDNGNKNASHELATERSVSKINTFTFHNDWQTHWSNELEFGAEKAP